MFLARCRGKLFFLFTLLFILLFMVGCENGLLFPWGDKDLIDDEEKMMTDEYMGLVVGATWTYATWENILYDGEERVLESVLTMKVLDVTEKDSSLIYKIGYSKQDSVESTQGDTNFSFGDFIRKSEGAYDLIGYFYYRNGQYEEYFFDNPFFLLKSPLEIGDPYSLPISFLWVFRMLILPHPLKELIVEKEEVISSPMGDLTGFYMVAAEEIEEGDVTYIYGAKAWKVPYLGEVKSSIFMRQMGDVEEWKFEAMMELLDFSH